MTEGIGRQLTHHSGHGIYTWDKPLVVGVLRQRVPIPTTSEWSAIVRALSGPSYQPPSVDVLAVERSGLPFDTDAAVTAE